MNNLILMRGIPGSGKSTTALKLASFGYDSRFGDTSCIVSADQFMYADGQEWSFDRLAESHSNCFAECRRLMLATHRLIIVDNTNVKATDLYPYKTLSQELHYNFSVYQIHVDPYAAHARGKHEIPLEAVVRYAKRMWSERLPNGWEVWSKGTPWEPPPEEEASPEDDIEQARR